MAHPRQTIHAESTKREYRKFIGVLLFLFFAATLMSTLISFNLEEWFRWYAGSALLVFGGFKLISYESFVEVIPQYDPLAARFSWYAHAYPIVEVLLGFFFILDLAPSFRYLVTFVFMAAGLAGMYANLAQRGPSREHTWLGNVFKLPMTTAILFEDIIVTVISLGLVAWMLVS